MPATEITAVRRIDRHEAPSLADTEYRRLATLAGALSPDEWAAPTECPGWTVRSVLAHVAGAMEGTSLRQGARQRRLAARRSAASGRPFLDEMNESQIEERSGRSSEELVRELRSRTAPAVRARRRVPAVLRRAPIPGSGDGLTLGDLLDVVLTRDVWMHRIDVCRAVGRPPHLTPEHDGRLVADVVREWADRHAQPFTLHLGGPAGGTFVSGVGGPDITLDAAEFCRTLSGRVPGQGLLANAVVF